MNPKNPQNLAEYVVMHVVDYKNELTEAKERIKQLELQGTLLHLLWHLLT